MADPFMATPAGAGISVGASFLQNYLAQQAAREKEKREALAKAAQQESDAVGNQARQQQGAFGKLMDSYGRVFT
jgi:predicted alpha/beta-fold hydrolase